MIDLMKELVKLEINFDKNIYLKETTEALLERIKTRGRQSE